MMMIMMKIMMILMMMTNLWMSAAYAYRIVVSTTSHQLVMANEAAYQGHS
jgi:hypothetical protein